MDLSVAEIGKEYVIKSIETDDEELNSFLFSLGCVFQAQIFTDIGQDPTWLY